MAVLLDTSPLPGADRQEALRAALSAASAPTSVELANDPADRAPALINVWQLGEGTRLISARLPALRLHRTPGHIKRTADERISLSVLSAGRSRLSHLGQTRDSQPNQLCLVDLTSTYYYERARSPLSQHTVYVDNSCLVVPVDLVRRAAPRLPSSPLYELTRDHLRNLADAAARSEDTPVAELLGSATRTLVRALLVTAAADDTQAAQALHELLPDRIRFYIREHLTEADLTPARVARAHHISERYLFKLWSSQDVSLAETIMNLRLEGARKDLKEPQLSTRTVAETARRWGFSDSTHFARRFRQAYGQSPGRSRSSTETDPSRQRSFGPVVARSAAP